MAHANTKPALAGKKKWRPEKNPGVDARDNRADKHNGETPQKPAQGLRQLRGLGPEDHLCHCK